MRQKKHSRNRHLYRFDGNKSLLQMKHSRYKIKSMVLKFDNF